MIVFVIIQLALAAGLIIIGQWGRTNGHVLVPGSLPEDYQESRLRAIRRGALVCQIVGVLFAIAVIPTLL